MSTSTDMYATPQTVDDLVLAFPATLGALLPPISQIPDEYPKRLQWQRFQNAWFGGDVPDGCVFEATEGVDPEMAYRHLAAIQRSFEPRHEHKIAAVAWLASRWLTRVYAADGSYSCP